MENSDLLLVLGCRLNIRQISYNYKDFAKDAYKIIVDIDRYELEKPTVHPDLPIWANVADVMRSIANSDYEKNPAHARWLAWCRTTDARYPACLPRYYDTLSPMNVYAFLNELFLALPENEVTVTLYRCR